MTVSRPARLDENGGRETSVGGVFMAKTILVPLDGSTFAEHAVPVAMALARSAGARLHLVQVHEVPVVPTSPDLLVPYDAQWDSALRQQEEEYLQSVANRIAERAGLQSRTELLSGPAEMALATYAREMEVDLVVMTTHGRSGLSRMWLGSVADGVIRRSQVPVLLLRPSHAELDYEEELRPAHILCPLDGSELSRGIIDAALWIGGLSEARYTLLRVTLPIPLLRPQIVTPESGNEARLMEEEQSHVRAEMEQLAAPLRARGLQVETAVVSHGVPAVAILDYAATHAVDLIALATHGRGGWSRLALGSVADKVLRGSMMPVLVYRPPVPTDEGNGVENGQGARSRA